MTATIFDLGCHRGEDSRFYLAKGFRVIGVEANPSLCANLRAMFSKEIVTGQFALVDRAIAEREGTITFYVSDTSIWGSIRPDWAGRDATMQPIEVPAITFGSLIEQFGMPHYIKIDIEGADMLCLEGLLKFSERPRYVSFESERRAVSDFLREFTLLRRLGCRRFQVVNQRRISEQREPFPSREGRYAGVAIESESSGLFGGDLSWLSSAGFLAKYGAIYAREKAAGACRKVGLTRVADTFNRWDWYDIHASW